MSETNPISAAALGSMFVPAPPASMAVVASDVTASTPDGTPVQDVVYAPEAADFHPDNVTTPESAFRRSQTPQEQKEQHPILKHFEYGHLPLYLAAVSKEFHTLAHLMAEKLPSGPELSAGLRKLLEAKDCMVRAAKL